MRLSTLLVALSLACAPARAQDAPKRGARLSLPALAAELDPAGGRIVDAKGREVLLRGVNVNALAEYWQYGSFPTTFPFEPADADRIAGIGWNAVRLLVSWSRVEPSPGEYDESYLKQVARVVRLLAKHNVYTIIDFHQDAWGPALAARPGEACTAPAAPAFGWDGAPAWATLDGGAPRCFTLFREVNPAVQAAFAAFFSNAPGPGGMGIRTRYVRMLHHVAWRFATQKAIAGYDVMNEPNAFGAEQVAALGQLYADAIAEMRSGEAAGDGFPHLVFFEPSITWSDFASGTPPSFAHDGNIVFAPHIYRGGLTAGPIPREDFERARADAAAFGGAPVLVGEWGSDPRRADDPTDTYFERHQAYQDEFRFSATLWTWRESCGDPHKAGDVRAGREPYVWGEFHVDCATNAVAGIRQSLVEALTRGRVRAAPGRLASTSYDDETGVLTATGTAAPRRSQLVAYWPARLFGTPAVESSGLVRVATRPAWGGVYVIARAAGGDWSLTVAPEAPSTSFR